MQVPDEMTTSLSFQTDVSTVRRNWYSRIGSLRLFNFQNVFWNGVPKKIATKSSVVRPSERDHNLAELTENYQKLQKFCVYERATK